MKKDRKGFKCKCGRYEKFSAYVYAHTQDSLVFTCPKCKKRYEILDAQAYELKEELSS